jgi:hypothetical protein
MQIGGQRHRHRQLEELGRLHIHHTQVQPMAAATTGAEHRHQGEQHERREEEPRRPHPELQGRDARDDPHGGDADQQTHALRLHHADVALGGAVQIGQTDREHRGDRERQRRVHARRGEVAEQP